MPIFDSIQPPQKIHYFAFKLKKMSEFDMNLCRICLSSNTDRELPPNTYLSKFFNHVLDIRDPLGRIWLCSWCKSLLRKTAKLIQVAEESQEFLLNLKKNKVTYFDFNKHRSKLYKLSHHMQHSGIEPKEIKPNKSKSKKCINNIQFVDSNEANEDDKVEKVKVENDTIDLKQIKIEIDVEPVDTKTTEVMITHNDRNDEEDTKKVDPTLYEKCEKNNFTLKILSLEEQNAELEEKKQSEKYLSRRYKCEFCGIGFVSTHVFEGHMKKHEKSYSHYECSKCHIHLNSQLVLSHHLLAHERRFHCKLCGYVTSRYNDCQYHRQKCGRPVPGVCPHCKKVFSNQYCLDQHVKGVHYSKEKKFVCSYCDRRFQSSQRLAIHTRTHTGAKPYSCEVCHRTFASNSNLRYHRATHAQARPYYCVECDKSYKTGKGLRRHLIQGATHLRKNVHSCRHCLKNFASDILLETHISSVHTKEIEEK